MYACERLMVPLARTLNRFEALFFDFILGISAPSFSLTPGGPLRERLKGKRVGVLVCGSNIDGATFARYLAEGGNGME